MNLATILAICRKMVEQERRILFDIIADPAPFFSKSNIRELKRRMDAIEDGTAKLEEYELIEVD